MVGGSIVNGGESVLLPVVVAYSRHRFGAVKNRNSVVQEIHALQKEGGLYRERRVSSCGIYTSGLCQLHQSGGSQRAFRGYYGEYILHPAGQSFLH